MKILAITLWCFIMCIGPSFCQYCPEGICEMNARSCGPAKEDCPDDTHWVEKTEETACGCCSACVKYRKEGEACMGRLGKLAPPEDVPDAYLPATHPSVGRIKEENVLLSEKCEPPLKCNQGVCETDPGSDEVCWERLREYNEWHETETWMWKPECTEDGKFAAKQCKGDLFTGRCFCVDETGEFTYGSAWKSDAENMTCACSRQSWDLKKEDENEDVTLVCETNGNYRELQCQSGMCYCLDALTGKVNGSVVTEAMWKNLPCYDSVVYKNDYLQDCFREHHRIAKLYKMFKQHGTKVTGLIFPNCYPDQGPNPVQCNGMTCSCYNSDWTKTVWTVGQSAKDNMNCYCARDQELFAAEGYSVTESCDWSKGNYMRTQCKADDTCYCVDKTGTRISNFFGTSKAEGMEFNKACMHCVLEERDKCDKYKLEGKVDCECHYPEWSDYTAKQTS